MSYADAIKKASRQEKYKIVNSPGFCTKPHQNTWRADAIETPANTCIDETFVPRVVRRQWAVIKKSTTSEVGTQTEYEPVTEATQTYSEAQTQTTEVEEKAVQPYEDTATQTAPIDKEKEAEDQYFFTTLFQIVGMLMSQQEAEGQSAEWREMLEKFNFVAAKMSQRGFPVKTATTYRRSQRTVDRPFQKYYQPYSRPQ